MGEVVGLAVTAITGVAVRAGNLYLDELGPGCAVGDGAFRFAKKTAGRATGKVSFVKRPELLPGWAR